MNILPDSRAREAKGVIRYQGINWVPVYCANCGKEAGMVPESHITCCFALCDYGCVGKYGDSAAGYVDPDAIYRERVSEEAFRKYGRPLTAEEVDRELADKSSPFTKIARDFASRKG